MAENSFDIAVVGGGPGGYVAAIRASQLGFKTCVVEREHLGGICLNWGCIPTKALLHTAQINHLLHSLDQFGFKADNVSFDVAKVVKHSRDTAKKLSQGVTHLLKKNKVTVIDGHAKLAGQGKLAVEKDGKKVQDVQAKHIILAPGARARQLPHIEADGETVWTYKEAMVPKEMPKKMLVIGSGAIGMEFASFYHDMGVDVTVAEVVDRILPAEDREISDFARKTFEKKGIKIHTEANVEKVEQGNNGKTGATATLKTKDGKTQQLEVDKVVLSVGIVANTENLGLEGTKVETERSHIKTDQWMRTGEPGVYAIGDATGAPWLAHKASHEGVICVEKIAGLNDVHPLDTKKIPACTYCTPQVASVGLSEQAAKDAGHKVKVGRFPYRGNGKALAMGEDNGMVKTVFDETTGELLGAHLIGAEVTELIQGYSIAQTLETTETELMHTVFPHPTLSEMMHESVLDAYGRAIHF
jgi:dihydrolipoamide dehydrogenase